MARANVLKDQRSQSILKKPHKNGQKPVDILRQISTDKRCGPTRAASPFVRLRNHVRNARNFNHSCRKETSLFAQRTLPSRPVNSHRHTYCMPCRLLPPQQTQACSLRSVGGTSFHLSLCRGLLQSTRLPSSDALRLRHLGQVGLHTQQPGEAVGGEGRLKTSVDRDARAQRVAFAQRWMFGEVANRVGLGCRGRRVEDAEGLS